jgi:hypothetical protein
LRLVVSGVPFHWTTDPDTRLVPRTLRVKALLPAETIDGVRREMDGGAPDEAAVTVNVDGADTPPSTFTTLTLISPALASSDAGTEAVNWVALTKVVTRAVEFHLT